MVPHKDFFEDRDVPSPGMGSAGGAGEHAGSAFLLAAIAAFLIARIPLMTVRAFDVDEFEHAHAAWNVWRGLLPYKDFFEHHTPWYYFTLAPFLRWFAVDQSFDAARHFLIFARAVSLVLTALSAALLFAVGRLGASRRVGLLAALFFVALPVVTHKTLEIRPDVPALPFFIGALWFLLRGIRAEAALPARHRRFFLGAGLCLGAAVMCTQKMLFVIPGALMGLGLWSLAGGRQAFAFRTSAIAILLVGVVVPIAGTLIAFALRAGGDQFIHDNFLLNARWRWYSGRHLGEVVPTSVPILVLAVVGAWSALFRERSAPRRHGDMGLLCIAGGLVAGLVVVPAAYQQYYVPILTIACLFAARGLSFLLDFSRGRAGVWLVAGATLPFLIWPAVDLSRSRGERNDVQMARLQFVFAHTRPTDLVLDGWLGTNVFRPHPLQYGFMHRELLVSLTDSERDAYLDALTSRRVRPALIALDDELRAIGPRFLEYLQRDYVSSDGLFYFPAQPSSVKTTP
jgi:hypothetical protein